MNILMIDDNFVDKYIADCEAKAKVAIGPESSRRWNRMESFLFEESNGFGTVATERNVAIYELKGSVTKEWCDGTLQLMDSIERNETDPAVFAHLIEIDSGGGEATNIDTVCNYIRYSVNKPIYALINGFCCSAAYYIAAGCDKIYVTEPTDVVGSIGVMLTFRNFEKYYEKMGIAIHEIYADQSTAKNSDYHNALKGKYEEIKQNFLNPYAAQFIKKVGEMRTITDETIYAGRTCMLEEAQTIGLIDGLMTYEDAKTAIFAEGTKFYNKNNKRNMDVNMNMSLPALEALMGAAPNQIVATNGMVVLPQGLVREIEARLSEQAVAPVATTTAKETEELKELKASILEMKSQFEKLAAAAPIAPVAALMGDATDTPPTLSAKDALLAEEKAMFA